QQSQYAFDSVLYLMKMHSFDRALNSPFLGDVCSFSDGSKVSFLPFHNVNGISPFKLLDGQRFRIIAQYNSIVFSALYRPNANEHTQYQEVKHRRIQQHY
ncbi:hypothetical protein Tsp_12699, partial [Trichinella spiralis]|uniref:hypothetical protein n=1 Tax=Trichinella spiralis TaxID=6334 RepID=UPI0001EFEB59